MNEVDFDCFTDKLSEYLKRQKIFIQNPKRMAHVNAATEMACKLFPDAEITLEDDPLQMGAVILCVKDFDITVRETKEFAELISNADNFEIYSTDDESVKMSVLFSNALTKIKK